MTVTKVHTLARVREIAVQLETAAPIIRTILSTGDALAELKSQVIDLHENRNNNVKDIYDLLKKNGLLVGQKDIKNILGIVGKTREKNPKKVS